MNFRPLPYLLAVLVVASVIVGAMPVCSEANSGVSHYDIDALQPGERALVTLPAEFDILPSNRLYLDGVLIEHATLTTAEGDSLYLNGVAILPHRPCPKSPPLPEETYAQIYGSVPFVQRLMESGASAREAGDAYVAEQKRIGGKLYELYVAARESGKSEDVAGAEAFAALRNIDVSGLIDWDGEVRQSGNSIIVSWKGMIGEEELILLDPGPEVSRMPDEMAKRLLATRLYELLGRGGAPCWYVVTCGGTSIAVGTDHVARMEAHLLEVLSTGVATDGALSRRAAREILEREGR